MARAASALGCTPVDLVVQVARVHGVLDIEPGAGRGADQVLAMWRAGEGDVAPPP